MKLVLFDCDGTLVDSADSIHHCMEAVFVEAGFAAPDAAATRSIIGLSLNIAIAQLLQQPVDATVERMTQRYRENFASFRQKHDYTEPLYDGILPLLEALSSRDDVVLGIVTGKSKRGVRHVFERHSIGKHFMVVRTADDCPSKPHPAMVLESCRETGLDVDRAIVVGDAIYDMQMARAAGALAAGVAWGYHPPASLNEAGAQHILDEPADLMTVLDKMDLEHA